MNSLMKALSQLEYTEREVRYVSAHPVHSVFIEAELPLAQVGMSWRQRIVVDAPEDRPVASLLRVNHAAAARISGPAVRFFNGYLRIYCSQHIEICGAR